MHEHSRKLAPRNRMMSALFVQQPDLQSICVYMNSCQPTGRFCPSASFTRCFFGAILETVRWRDECIDEDCMDQRIFRGHFRHEVQSPRNQMGQSRKRTMASEQRPLSTNASLQDKECWDGQRTPQTLLSIIVKAEILITGKVELLLLKRE